MWVVLVITAAQVVFAWAYLELMYRDAYYCISIPYEDGSLEVQCYYLP